MEDLQSMTPRRGGGETALPGVGDFPLRRRMILFAAFIVILSACFARPLYALWQYAVHNDFFSYIPLIPFITLYLIWLKRSELPRQPGVSWRWGAALAAGGAALLIGWACAAHPGWRPHKEDYLTVKTASYLLFAAAGCLVCFGSAISRVIFFPLAFLVFMVPMPSAMLNSVGLFFQQTSAVTASGMLDICGTPVMRNDLVLLLPGDFSLVIAPECSGIHSTMVLLITAVLAGHLFLHSGWKRFLLVVIVVPLAILRNGFRIFVIAELCVHISHEMINSPIHRRGGPVFFALSLIPFFLALLLLRKSEPRGTMSVKPTSGGSSPAGAAPGSS